MKPELCEGMTTEAVSSEQTCLSPRGMESQLHTEEMTIYLFGWAVCYTAEFLLSCGAVHLQQTLTLSCEANIIFKSNFT